MGHADDAFIEEHRGFVRSIASRLISEWGLQATRTLSEDLIAFGFEGLLGARARFDSERGNKFTTFAFYRVRGAMMDFVRRECKLSAAHIRRLENERIADAIAEDGGERAASLPQRSAELRAELLASVLDDFTTSFLLNEAVDRQQMPDANVDVETRATELEKAVTTTLNDRELTIVRAIYFEGRTLDDISKEVGVSKSWSAEFTLARWKSYVRNCRMSSPQVRWFGVDGSLVLWI